MAARKKPARTRTATRKRRDAARQIAESPALDRMVDRADAGSATARDVLNKAMLDIGNDAAELLLTSGAEHRLVERVLLKRGWSPAAIDRILAPKSPMEWRDIFTPTADAAYDPPRPMNRATAIGNNPVDEAPRQASELQMALGSLEREQERLDHVVAELEKKIEDVLRPRPPQGEPSTTAPAPIKPGFVEQSSQVGRCVVGVARRLQQIGDVIEDITRRAQV